MNFEYFNRALARITNYFNIAFLIITGMVIAAVSRIATLIKRSSRSYESYSKYYTSLIIRFSHNQTKTNQQSSPILDKDGDNVTLFNLLFLSTPSTFVLDGQSADSSSSNTCVLPQFGQTYGFCSPVK